MNAQNNIYNVLEVVIVPYFQQQESPIFKLENTTHHISAVTTGFLRNFQVTVLPCPARSSWFNILRRCEVQVTED